jgi:hypothetical protein
MIQLPSMATGVCNPPLPDGILLRGESKEKKEIYKILTTEVKSVFEKYSILNTANSKNSLLRLKFKLVNKFSGCLLEKILEESMLLCCGFHEAFPSKLLCVFLTSPSLLDAQPIGILNIFHHPKSEPG